MSSMPSNLYKDNEQLKIADNIYKTKIEGLYFIADDFHPDARGFFRSITLIPDLNKAIGFTYEVKQINHSQSRQNVVRGMHAENWNKLVTITNGVGFCALADVRPNSPTFRQKEYFLLGTDDSSLGGALFISKGIANSLCVIKGPVDYLYCFDQLYRDRDPKGDVAISLFDPDLGIEWPIDKEEMIISDRDISSVTLRQMYPDKFR